jgi:hypothetical protein
MSEFWCKVPLVMETNTESQTPASETPDTSGSPRYAELQALVAGMATDFAKFYKDGNKAAGTRVRNSMQELKALAQTIREEVLSIRNQGPQGSGKGEDSAQ